MDKDCLKWERFETWTDEELENYGLVRLTHFVACHLCGNVTNVAFKNDESKGVCCELCADGVSKPKLFERLKHFKGNTYQVLGYVQLVRNDRFYDYELSPIVKAMDCSHGDVMRTVEMDMHGNYICRTTDENWGKTQTETHVLYQGLYGEHKIFLREYNEFMGKVDKQKHPEVGQKYKYEKVKGYGNEH